MVNQIITGDCVQLMQEVKDDFVHLTLTDIPYGVVNRDSNGLRSFDKQSADEETFDIPDFLAHVVRITSGSIYIFCGTEQVSEIRKSLVANGLATRLCIWEKTNPSPVNGQHIWLSGIECCVFGKKKGATFNEHCKNSVWRYPTVRSKFHPTEKPLSLFSYLVKTSSKEGDLVFDPCIGSGTTAIAAIQNKRQFLGFEKNPEFAEHARNRILSQTNQ